MGRGQGGCESPEAWRELCASHRSLGDPFAVEWIDDRQDYGEERVILLGMTDSQLLAVVYTERESRLRIISARRATRYEQETYSRETSP
jgi:uncharacterized DUF497 family protein